MWIPKFEFFQLFIRFSQNLPPPIFKIIPDKHHLIATGTIPELSENEKALIEAYKTKEDIRDGFLTPNRSDGLFIDVINEIKENELNISTDSQVERYLTEAKEILNARLIELGAEYFPTFSHEQLEFNFFQNVQVNLNQLQEWYLNQNLNEHEKEISSLIIEYLKDTIFYIFHYYLAFDILTISQIKGNFKDGNERFQEHLRQKHDRELFLANNSNVYKSLNYCISESKIVALFNLLSEKKVLMEIDCVDFMKCFDLNNTPEIIPKYNHQNTMAYALSIIKKPNSKNAISQKIALANFGIRNYDSVKSQIKRRTPIEPLLANKINNIFSNN